MPTYDYVCPNGHTFEVFESMSAEPVESCPECGEQAERTISGAGYLTRPDRGEPPHAPRDPGRK